MGWKDIFNSLQSLTNKTLLTELKPATKYAMMSYLLIKSIPMEIIKSNKLEVETLSKDYIPGAIETASVTLGQLNKYNQLDVDVIWKPVEGGWCQFIECPVI